MMRPHLFLVAAASVALATCALSLVDARDAVPPARAHHRLVSDPSGQVLLVGGSTRVDTGYVWFDDIWIWRDGGWRRGESLPFRRSSHSIAYDRSRGTLVLLGGIGARGDVADGTVWVRVEDRWRRRASAPDDGWAEPASCYDRRRERVVIFGGWDRDNSYRADTWEWDGSELARVADTGPAPRAGHEMAFDPVRSRCIMFGGGGPDGKLGDTWEWDGSAWRRIATEGPPPRWFFGMAAADDWNRIVLFGGAGEGGDLADTWDWDGSVWKRIEIPGPSARGMSRLAYDGEHVVLFGGRQAGPGSPPFVDLDDTWLFDGESWTEAGR